MIKSSNISEEVLFVASRATSGMMNGSFYGDNWLGLGLGLIFTLVFTFLSIRNGLYKDFKPWIRFLFTVSLVMSLISIIFVAISFFSNFWIFDIHGWTWMSQAFQSLCMFIVEPKHWWRQVLLILPAVFFQKLFVNLFSGLKWNYNGTEYRSGKYWKMWGIKIPRAFSGNMTFRLIGTVLSLIILLVTQNDKRRIL